MAAYSVNQRAVKRAEQLIDARQYVLDSDWGDVQPGADAQNAFLKSHSWDEYAEWHLGLTEGANDETKARYAFVYGDFRRIHRMGLIACMYRAAEWRHKAVELAAHELLQRLDAKSGPLEQRRSERPVVLDRRRAVAERLQADVVGARLVVRLDRLGDRLRRAVRDDRVDQAVEPPSAMSASLKPKRSRFEV